MTEKAALGVATETMEHPACPVCCDFTKTFKAFVRAVGAIYICRNCGSEFLFPQPSDAVLASIYTSTYFIGSESDEGAERARNLKRATANLYLDAIVPFMTSSCPRLLEIGCGSGDFLAAAAARGFDVEGLEYSEHAVESVNARLGRKAVRVGSLDSVSLPANTFDVVAAFDVIEHVRDPRHALECLYAALRPGGIAAIATPSLDSWSRTLLGRHWMEYKTEHLTYFSRKSLGRVLEGIGFTSLVFTPNQKVLSLDYISQHFQRFPVPIASPAVRLIRAIIPPAVAHRQLKVVASGMMAFAKKS